MKETVISEQDGVVRLTINRPDQDNMLSDEVLGSMADHLAAVDAKGIPRVVVVTGAGATHFCNGVFTPFQFAQLTSEQIIARRRLANEVFDRLEGLACPVIAAVNGRAQAGGFEMALACDIRIAVSHAIFTMPETTWGVFPGAGGPIRLPRIVGPGKAMEIIMTGREVGASEALAIGLVDYLFDASQFAAEVDRISAAIAASAPLGNRAVKKLVRASLDVDLRSARAYSEALREPLAASADTTEGLTAAREGRRPQFQGR